MQNDEDLISSEAFEAMLKVEYKSAPSRCTASHATNQRHGLDEPEALQQFLAYLGNGVIVGHHIGHDVETLNAGYERHFGFSMKNQSLDTMD